MTVSATAAVACIGTWATDFRADLRKIDVPILVIQGDADQVLPLDKTDQRLPGLFHDAQLVVIDGGPHAIPWTHANQSTRPCWTSSAADIPQGVTMSNHFSADNLKFPGDDRRLDLTDLFVFTSADDPGKTVLIIDSNPTSAPPPIPAPITGPEFYPDAIYRINIDTDGDNHADVAFSFTFSEYQTASKPGPPTMPPVPRPASPGQSASPSSRLSRSASTHRPACQAGESGSIRLAAGLRSDPFFADVEGALHGFAWTGHDDFAGNKVDSIALEVPSDMPGGPVIGVWASISRYQDGILEQLDRGGNPTINPFINPDGAKNLFNSRQPADDVANYLEPWSKILENAGGYPPEQARAAALQVLPDILHYDRTKPDTYPNGRILTDDVYSLRFAWLSNGKIPPSGLKPHGDLLAGFPYLGPPNP